MKKEARLNDATAPFPDRELKPFVTWRLPRFEVPAERLIADSDMKAQDHIDTLGAMLFQSRDDILDTFKVLATDAAYRARLGKIKAKEFDALSTLEADQRATALSIAEMALNRMIEQVVGHLAAGARAYPGAYCIEYTIDSVVKKITDADSNGVRLESVGKCRISEGTELSSSFRRWLAMFGRRHGHV
jgi:hypothetical protein